MADYIVVGGGISGLATAWFLHEAGQDVQVLEAGGEVGGTMCSRRADGFLTEAGPNSTMARGGALEALIDAVGLREAMLEGSKIAKNRYIVKRDRLRALPGGPGSFFTTPLFSPWAKLRLFFEPLAVRAAQEETVAAFVRRRLGREFLDWAIDPFISGVYAGDPNRLSARAATAKVYALEAEAGSLLVGALKRAFKGRKSGPTPRGRLISFTEGMQMLPTTIAAKLGERVRTGMPVKAISQAGQGWQVTSAGGVEQAKQVILAVPAEAAAQLVAPLSVEAATALREIYYPRVTSIALGFRRDQVGHPLDGFGVLIPSREGRDTLGALFSSSLFPGRADGEHVLLTAFIGGARNQRVRDFDANSLVAAVLQDLRWLLDIQGEPVMTQINDWPHAIPQYELGHLARLERIDNALAGYPGLSLRANWRDGISVTDCVDHAKRLVDRLTA